MKQRYLIPCYVLSTILLTLCGGLVSSSNAPFLHLTDNSARFGLRSLRPGLSNIASTAAALGTDAALPEEGQ